MKHQNKDQNIQSILIKRAIHSTYEHKLLKNIKNHLSELVMDENETSKKSIIIFHSISIKRAIISTDEL